MDIDTLPDAPEMLIAHNISVTVDELKVNVLEADSGYKWLYPAVLKLALPLLKARMKMRMTQRLKEAVERASAEMVEIRRRVNAGSPEGTPAVRLGEVVVSEHDGASRILRIVLQRLKEIKHEADVRKALPRKKLWRLSTRLEDSLFPDVTQNGEKSIEYRRHRAETRARLASMGSGAAVRRPRMVTDTGLRAAETKAWRSSVFSFQ